MHQGCRPPGALAGSLWRPANWTGCLPDFGNLTRQAAVARFGKKRTFELVPVKDNDPNAEFNVDSMSAVEREALEEERLVSM